MTLDCASDKKYVCKYEMVVPLSANKTQNHG